MPALIFTADSTTNQLTSVAHGLVTGDGPVTPYTASGVLPTGSPAIIPTVDYWVIRDDADHVKLATSNANAMTGTFIDILTNGSGTLLLLIGLPYRRPRTYATKSQLKHEDLNSFSDDDVALWNLFTGQAQSIWAAATLAVQLNTNGAIAEAGIISTTLNSATANDDFTATGIGTASVIRLAVSGGAAPLSGLNAGVAANRSILLVNVSASNITVKHEAGTSSAQFRFSLPNSADVVIRPNGMVRAWYDLASTRYRLYAI